MILTEDEIMKKSSDYSEAHSKDPLQKTCLQQGYADGWADCQKLLQQTPCTTMLIYPCGTIVKTILSHIEGMITCQSIRFDKVQYEISYFNNGEQKTVWMNENEFETNVERKTIGFVQK